MQLFYLTLLLSNILFFNSFCKSSKLSIIGSGFYGSQAALKLAQEDIFDTIIITDIIDGKSEGTALDIHQCSSLDGFKTNIEGYTTTKDGNGYDKTANSDIIIITAGITRKPGMNRLDLLNINSKIIIDVVTNISKYSPSAIIIIVSNPIDEMVKLAKIVSKFPYHKIIGQAGILDSARLSYFISKKLNIPATSCKSLCLGSHGDLMVPCISQCKVNDKLLTDLLNNNEIEEICNRTRYGGSEIVSLLKTGSAYFCPAISVSKIAKAIILDTKEIFPCHAWINGEYGLNELFIGVEAMIGRNGNNIISLLL
jgi:malate dehydrogenase